MKQNIKDVIKQKLMNRLYSVPARSLNIANSISQNGIPNVIDYNFENTKRKTLSYIETLCIAPYTYKYAQSRQQPTLYASIYACMLLGLYGELDRLSASEKREWVDYFDSFQSEDGYFRDPALAGEEFEGDCGWGDGWGIRHLAGHIIIAYARLGHTPKNPFHFIKPYYETAYLADWLNSLFTTKDMWSASNYIMNMVTLMQYARDYMQDDKANQSIQYILNWLEERQNPETGMWHNAPLNSERALHTAIRGAYHYYPLFIYENRPIRYQEKVIDHILQSQNSWGGFEEELHPSGACEDIDALDPLIRFTLNTQHRKEEVDLAVQRAMYWVMTNWNKDGGFTFMPLTPHEYGSHPLTSSLTGESNLFATWFRTLCLAYIVKYLGIDNQFDIQKFPGYELPL